MTDKIIQFPNGNKPAKTKETKKLHSSFLSKNKQKAEKSRKLEKKRKQVEEEGKNRL